MTRRLARGLLLLGVLAIGLGVGAWLLLRGAADPSDVPPPPANVEPSRDTFALLVGCTEYPGLRGSMDAAAYEAQVRLRGPANDAALLHSVLRTYLGVPEENIRVLAGWPDDLAGRPTRANILGHLERLAREVPRGARVLFAFSGHGSQQPDQAGHEEADRQDEILMPSDTGMWDPALQGVSNAITDDELRVRLLALRDAGATVWALFDCCHSGTLMRGTLADATQAGEALEQVRMRQIPPALLGIPSQVDAPLAKGGPAPVGAVFEEGGQALTGIVAFYAAHSWEQAPEMMLPRSRSAAGRQEHGLCSFHVARTLQRYGGSLTLAELFQHVLRGYEALPWTDATPVAEGDLSLRVRPGSRPGGSVLLLRREGDQLMLEAGSLRGLTVGSLLEVYRPGGFGDPGSSLGRIQLTEVEPLRSVCGGVAGGPEPASIPDGAPARLVEVAAGGAPLRLALLDATGAALTGERLERVRGAAFGTASSTAGVRARFPSVEEEQADWLLSERAAGSDGTARFLLAPARSSTGVEPLEVALPDLLAVLERVQRSESLRRLAQPGALSRLPEGMVVEALVQRFGSQERGPLAAGGLVAPGDQLVLRLVNGTGRDVDVAVKNLDTALVESHVWPQAEPCRRLTREEKDPIEVPMRLTDDGLGRESLIIVVAVRAQGAAPLDIGQLSGAALEGAPDTTLKRQGERALLDALAPAGVTARGDGPGAESVAIHEVTWTTSWGRMGIPSALLQDMVVLDPPVVSASGAAGATLPPGRRTTWQRARILPGDDTRADALLLSGRGEVEGEGAIGLLVDADGDAELATADPADAARRAAAGTLPVELMLVLAPSRSGTAYATRPGDTELSLMLVGATGQKRADRRYELAGAVWTARPTAGPWLSTSFVRSTSDTAATRRRIVAALRSILRVS